MQSELAPRSLRGAEGEPDDAASAAASAAEDSESPFIRRVFSGQRRRRAVTDLSGAARRRPSFRRDVGHAASETYLITRLTLILLRSLGVGYRWITKCLALGCYAMLLMPGFLQVAYYYFFSNQVRRSVVYGEQPRNRLDLYLPIDNDGSKPVVAFVTGGAWIIGYKAWGALLGKRLSERGIIVACIDYRNFPQGTISDMVNDVSKGISFVCNNAASFGADADRIYLIGQSAGAHIAACTLFDQVIKECGEGESTGWSACQIKTYFGLSGGKRSAPRSYPPNHHSDGASENAPFVLDYSQALKLMLDLFSRSEDYWPILCPGPHFLSCALISGVTLLSISRRLDSLLRATLLLLYLPSPG